jgi:hypothetical protein
MVAPEFRCGDCDGNLLTCLVRKGEDLGLYEEET